jgi:hypothetical protein
MGGTTHGPIFLVLVVAGVGLVFLGPAGQVPGNQLIHYGMKGLLVDQQIAKEEREFEREIIRRQLAEKEREAEFERQLRMQRLQRPASPEEAY